METPGTSKLITCARALLLDVAEDEPDPRMEASHLCSNKECLSISHISWELPHVNISRRTCISNMEFFSINMINGTIQDFAGIYRFVRIPAIRMILATSCATGPRDKRH